jgi:hypothetical protein
MSVVPLITDNLPVRGRFGALGWHCKRFTSAATRRSLDGVEEENWPNAAGAGGHEPLLTPTAGTGLVVHGLTDEATVSVAG